MSLVILHKSIGSFAITHSHIFCVSFLELLEGGIAVEHDCLQMCACVHVLKEQDVCEGFSEQAC